MTIDQDYGPWDPLTLSQVVELMTDAPMRWWVTGGHALELHFGRSWRDHDDMDISILRSDAPKLRSLLPEFDIHVAAAGVLTPWTGHALSADRSQNNLWCKRSANAPWCLDAVLSDGDANSWIYRRDTSVHRPWSEAILYTADGVPYLAPELQLLFKSKNPRPKDDIDAVETIPLLDDERRSWLGVNLDPEHPWQATIQPRQV